MAAYESRSRRESRVSVSVSASAGAVVASSRRSSATTVRRQVAVAVHQAAEAALQRHCHGQHGKRHDAAGEDRADGDVRRRGPTAPATTTKAVPTRAATAPCTTVRRTTGSMSSSR